jgi:hypothetical protein
MRTITYEAAEEQEETVSAFWMMVLEYGKEIGRLTLLERLVQVAMKEVVYSRLQKAQTVMASLVMGCKHTHDINEILSQEPAAANYLWMERLPDPSPINRYLTRFDTRNVEQLGEVHAQRFERQSQARRARGEIVVDIDPCGLVVSGQSYELARTGYFPRKRGEKGYPVSAA